MVFEAIDNLRLNPVDWKPDRVGIGWVAIYALVDDESIFYIGQSRTPETRQTKHRRRFIERTVDLRIIEWVALWEAGQREQYWINRARALGFSLCNANRAPFQ